MLDRPAAPADLIEQAAEIVRESLDELVRGARDAIGTLTERMLTFECERDEAREAEKAVRDDRDREFAELVETLTAVKYWMHDAYVLGRPVADPRPLLRRIEDVLREADPMRVEKAI